MQVEVNQDQKSTIDPPGLQAEAFTESMPDPASHVRPTEDHSEQQHDLACPGLRSSPFQEPSRPNILDLSSLVRVAKSSPNLTIVSNSGDAHYRISTDGDAHSHHDQPRAYAVAAGGYNGGGGASLGVPLNHTHTTHNKKAVTAGVSPP